MIALTEIKNIFQDKWAIIRLITFIPTNISEIKKIPIQINTNYYQKWIKDNNNGYMSSYILFELGDVEIVLIESVNCNNRSELNKRTGELIREHINNVVNTELFKPVKEKYNILTDDEWKPKLFHNSYGDWKTCKCKKSYRVESEKQHMSSEEHIEKINGAIYVKPRPVYYPFPPPLNTDGFSSCYSTRGFSNC